MKLAIAVSTPEVSASPIGITGKDFLAITRQCAALGYHGIELMPQNPDNHVLKQVMAAIQKNKLEVPMIGTGLIYALDRLTLFAPESQLRVEALARVKVCVDWAREFGAMVSLGGVRGRMPDYEAGSISAATQVLTELCTYADSKNVKLVLEPINRYENNFVNTAREGLAFLKMLNTSVCGLLLDLFHVNIEESSFIDAIFAAGHLLWHVHLADSNRWPPGYGHFDFAAIFRMLKAAGYQGYISAELLGLPTEQQALQQTAQLLLPLLAAIQKERPIQRCW